MSTTDPSTVARTIPYAASGALGISAFDGAAVASTAPTASLRGASDGNVVVVVVEVDVVVDDVPLVDVFAVAV